MQRADTRLEPLENALLSKQQITTITSRAILSHWRKMIKRIVACRSQANHGYSLAEHHAVIPSRPFTLKNDSARPASLNFIYNPHLIIIQPHAHHARTRWGYPLRLAGKEQLTTGGVDDTEKNCFAAPAKGPRRCRSGPCNRSWFRYFLLINSSHVVPWASSTPAPPRNVREVPEYHPRFSILCENLTVFPEQFNTFPDICLHQDVTVEFFL